MAAIRDALVADGALAGLLGGPRVHDRVPRGAPFPFVAFARTDASSEDGDDAPLTEHRLSLEVVSRAHGRREAAEIADRIVALLHDAPLALEGHRLVNLRHVETRLRPERDRRTFGAEIRLRAVTEPA
jgi:hypothetical protein